MVFKSILWPEGQKSELNEEYPEFFIDLNLDQIIDGIVKPYEKYDLRSLYSKMPGNLDSITYRQKIFKDIWRPEVAGCLRDFSRKMKDIRAYLSGVEKLYEYQKEGVFLDAALLYFDAMASLAEKINILDLNSEGLRSLREYIISHVNSNKFKSTSNEAHEIKNKLSTLKYELTIENSKITVRKDHGRKNYNEEIYDAFGKFRNNWKSSENLQRFNDMSMNHVEAAVLALIARIYPDEFLDLTSFYNNHKDLIDPTIDRFHKDLQFYLSYLDYISPVIKAGLSFCIPEINTGRGTRCIGTFDLALAHKLSMSGSMAVINDFELSPEENTIVVTGPNNGGKTTFARCFGQVHYLAALGLPVPGTEARLFLIDNLYTHFEKSEEPENLRGKLEDDLVRIKNIIDDVTDRSLVIINEMLSSTATKDAIGIGGEIIDLLIKKNVVCLYVTFLDEFARLDGVVSLVAQVNPRSPGIRTFKIRRSEPNGLAYAMAIAEKYGVTYDRILEVIKN